jgi:MFS family permease
VFVLIPLTSSFMQLALLVAVAGLAQGLSLGSVATSTYDVVPAHVRGRLQAVRRTVAELGSGLAPLFGGYLANTFNPGVPFLFLRSLAGGVSDPPGGGRERDAGAVAQTPLS